MRAPAVLLAAALAGCGGQPWNNPYPAADAGANIVYSSFEERPKHLDPARSYSSNEVTFTGQIYEPPLQYHYLKRPYTLIPLTAEGVPVPQYLDREGRPLPADAPDAEVAYSVYEIRIRPGILYQPHPAFARDEDGNPVYRDLSSRDLADVHSMGDFARTGTRELVAADYVYQIKRLAHPRVHSPILGLMGEYIVGLREYAAELARAYADLGARAGGEAVYLDLERYPLAGAEAVDRYTYRIKVKGKYPQLLYWLAMPFFAPIPPEADRFHSAPGMEEKNLTLDWYPVGTGPYMLTVNNPNRQMVLERNPNFHEEYYPLEGDPGDREAGLLGDAGQRLPFIDKVVFSLEKETIPYWNKFLQGYYDTSGISSDSFDQAVRMGSGGEATLTERMKEKGIRLQTAVGTSIFYTGINMLDPVIGGYSERQRLLRQAISIALDYEEFISIFANGRGIAAQGPIPPGIFGHAAGEAGINPYVYGWSNGAARRKSLDEARRLLREAGYGDGVDAETGRPLVLNLDITAGGPEDKARLEWFRKQFEKLNIQLVIRNTDYNRFQDKMRNGSAQIFMWGWNADYPDPENFLFLLYGPNGKVRHNGENAANYANPEFDRLFEQMKTMSDGPQRQELIDRMVDIVREDAPWIWGFHPKSFALYHAWSSPTKPNLMANNLLKYRRIDPALRERLRAEWNRPLLWPLLLALGLLAAVLVPAVIGLVRRQHRAPAVNGDMRTP
ncbi:MAG: ABC transporter substrate-binding protein [Gammaproteobacteria bacterium]|nr:ABC transporter substrate-binding protein [Gammaproteobacteria bacterium]